MSLFEYVHVQDPLSDVLEEVSASRKTDGPSCEVRVTGNIFRLKLSVAGKRYVLHFAAEVSQDLGPLNGEVRYLYEQLREKTLSHYSGQEWPPDLFLAKLADKLPRRTYEFALICRWLATVDLPVFHRMVSYVRQSDIGGNRFRKNLWNISVFSPQLVAAWNKRSVVGGDHTLVKLGEEFKKFVNPHGFSNIKVNVFPGNITFIVTAGGRYSELRFRSRLLRFTSPD